MLDEKRLDENVGVVSGISGTDFGLGCSAERTAGERSGCE
jgi:hypothetical protein